MQETNSAKNDAGNIIVVPCTGESMFLPPGRGKEDGGTGQIEMFCERRRN